MNFKSICLASAIVAQFLPAGAAHAALSDGLVAYYPFDGNANDATGHGYNGTVYNATLVADNRGRPAHAYSFNGIDSYIYFGPVLPDMTAMSVSFWTYTAAPSGASIFGDADWIPGNDVLVVIPSNNSIYLRDDKNGASLFDTVTVAPSLAGSWHYITWTLSPQGSVLYLDGAQVQSTQDAISNIGYHDFILGTMEYPQGLLGWDGFMSGSVTQLRIYNRVLSGNEVKALYTESSATSNPVAGEPQWINPPFQVKCTNKTTSQSITLQVDTGTAYNCEASGLKARKGDTIAVTVMGTKN